MPNRLTAFWALLRPSTRGDHPAWVRAVLAVLGVLVFVLVVGFYVRYAWGMEQISDGFLIWTAMVMAVGVFSLTAASKKEKGDDDGH